MRYNIVKDANKILKDSKYLIDRPEQYKNKWKDLFGNNNPIHLELGCGRGQFLTRKSEQYPNINHVAVDLKDEVLVYALRKVQESEQEINNARIVALNISFIAELCRKDLY